MNKKIGWGTLSIPLFIFAVLVSKQLGRTLCPGDVLLDALGLNHSTWIQNKYLLSMFLLIGGLILGVIFKKDLGAQSGRNLCIIFAFALGIVIIGHFFKISLSLPFEPPQY